MNIRKAIAIFPLLVLVLGLILVACQSAGMGGVPTPSAVDLILQGTAVASQLQSAEQQAAAYAAQVAAVTAQAAQTSSAATSSWQSTTDAWALAVEQGNATATTAAQSTADAVAATVAQMDLNAKATDAEATAVVQRQVIQSNNDMLEEERRKGEARARREELMGYLSLGATAVGIILAFIFVPIAAMRLLNYFTNERRRIQIIDGAAVAPANMYQLVSRPSPRLLEQHEHPALPAGEEEEHTPRVDIVELPSQLLPDRIGFGVDVSNPANALWLPPSRIDVLVAGLPEVGKSNFGRLAAYQAYMMKWQLYLADPEPSTFPPSRWGNVALTVPDVVDMLHGIVAEIDRRMEMYDDADAVVSRLPGGQQYYVDTLDTYNRAAEQFGLEPLRPMLLVMDEANNLLGQDNDLDALLFEILRRRRKAGMGCILCGHVWHARQVGSQLSNLLATRLAFSSATSVSRVVLGTPDAASIPKSAKGRAIIIGDGRPYEMQTYYLPAERVNRDVRPDGAYLPPVDNMTHHLPAGHSNGHGSGSSHVIVSGYNEEAQQQRDILHRYYIRSQSLTGIANDLFGSRGGPGFSERVRPTVVDTPAEEVIRILGEQYREAILQRHAVMLESLRT